MSNFNQVILMGRLTRTPELRYTPKGTAVTDLGIATNRVRNDPQTGERREETTFVDVTFWGKQAETVCKYLEKGRPIFLQGRLVFDQWEQDGQRRSKLKVVGENFQFIDSPVGRDGGSFEKGASGGDDDSSKPKPPWVATDYHPASGDTSGAASGDSIEDSEIPF